MAKKKKAKKAPKRRTGGNLFALAAKQKSFKSAKKALHKAEARSKKAWKKAVAVAKRKLKRRK